MVPLRLYPEAGLYMPGQLPHNVNNPNLLCNSEAQVKFGTLNPLKPLG